jgi:exodeoxyribonuclease VII small subunit
MVDMNAKAAKADFASVETLSFEAAMAELESIVRDLETGKAALEDSISAYERGIALKNHCEKKLRDAQAKIEKITLQPDGKITTQPFEE